MEPALLELYAEGAPEDEVALIMRLSGPAEVPPGVRIVAQFGPIVTCRMPRGEIPRVRGLGQVASMKRPRIYTPTPVETAVQDDAAHEYASSSPGDLFAAPSDTRRPEHLPYTGDGVYVGHIDWGLDFTHPDFREAGGQTRLAALWDQGAPYNAARPNRYGYGRIYFADEINRALRAPNPFQALGYHPYKSDPGLGTHGSHTMGISSGGGAANGPLGVAPQARLVFVDLSTMTAEGPAQLGSSVAFLEGIDMIANVAAASPLVINASLGRQAGEHDGATLTEQGMEAFVTEQPGRAIVQSAGNYFNRDIHASVLLRPGETYPLRFVIEPADRTPNEVDLWYPGVDRVQVKLLGPGGVATVECAPDQRAVVIENGSEVGRIYHRLGDPNNRDNQVSLFLDRDAPPGVWTLLLFGEAVADGRVHVWMERDAGCPQCQARFVVEDSDATCTTGTICNGFRTIAVGAYDAHQAARPLAKFSSSGPTRDGRTKPDLVAPGVRVLAARSRPRDADDDPPRLTRMSGTSMAAPHVSGTIALMFEAAGRPLAIDETRRLLLANTDAVPEDASDADRLRLGSGFLNTVAAVMAAEQAGREPPDEFARVNITPPGALNVNRGSRTMNTPTTETDTLAIEDQAQAELSAEQEDARDADANLPADQDVFEDDAEAAKDKRRVRKPPRVVRPRRAGPPVQLQVPVTGGAPSLAVPLGARSPIAMTVPLGATGSPAKPPTATTTSPAATAPATPLTGGELPNLPEPTNEEPVAAEPAPPGTTEEPAPAMGEPVATEPVAAAPVLEPGVPAVAEPAKVPEKTGTTSVAGEYDEARRERVRSFAPTFPFQVQIPITGGAPAIALPIGGYNSPLAFSIPLGGTPSVTPVVAPPAAANPAQPWLGEPLVTVASPPQDPLYMPPLGDEPTLTTYENGIQWVANADELASEAELSLTSSAAQLGRLWSAGVEALEAEESFAPSGERHFAPSATELFNVFVHPNHPWLPRNALYRDFSRRFSVLAFPGQALHDVAVWPGDLMIRVASGEAWGQVAVIADVKILPHSQLANAGLRGEGFPRMRPGLYAHVIELGPRPRRFVDRYARRIGDDAGRVPFNTLLLRPRFGEWAPENIDEAAIATPSAAFPTQTTRVTARPTLRRGASGEHVVDAQRKLNRIHTDATALGLPGLAGCPLVEDGRFGERMETAVVALQQSVFSDPRDWDGVIGPKTWVQLDLLAGGAPSRATAVPAQAPEFVGDDGAEADGTNRSGPDYLRWLQAALNQIDNAHLVVDGVMGANTRAALRRFQQRHALVADGVPGPQTERALLDAGAPPPTGFVAPPPTEPPAPLLPPGLEPDLWVLCPPPSIVVDRFPLNGAHIQAHQRPVIAQTARQIVASYATATPVHLVCLIGHTDNSGAPGYNKTLGRQRAENVEKALRGEIAALRPDIARALGMGPYSEGEETPIARNDTPEGRAQNRRVEIYLNQKYKQPRPQNTLRIEPGPIQTPLFAVEGLVEAEPQAASPIIIFSNSPSRLHTRDATPGGTFEWSSSDPSVVALTPDSPPQSNPNQVRMTNCRPGRAAVGVRYTTAGGSASSQRDVVHTTLEIADFTEPLARPVAEPAYNHLLRPNLYRSDALPHRVVRAQLLPADFWSGKSVQWTFAAEGNLRGAPLPVGRAHLEAVGGANFTAANGRSVVAADGTVAVRINLPNAPFNRGRLTLTSVDFAQVTRTLLFDVPAIVVIDPGHGGAVSYRDSSANNAQGTASHVKEKALALDIGLRVRDALRQAPNRPLDVFMTRDTDINLSGAARAHTARVQGADVFLSIHFNGANAAAARGSSCFVRAAGADGQFVPGNVNRDADLALARRVQQAMVAAIPGGRNHGGGDGVHDDSASQHSSLAVLNDLHYGNNAGTHPIRGCLAEIEFLSNPTVDDLFTGANADANKQAVANAIRDAIFADLDAQV